MKTLFTGLLCSAVVLGAVCGASADPSMLGPTGLIFMPTADSLEQGQVEGFVNYIDLDEDEVTAFGANAGVGMGVELGISSRHGGGSATIFNAKWNFMKETTMSPGIAVGAINLAGDDDFSDDITPYVVLSKRLSLPESNLALTGHVGYLSGDYDELMIGASVDLTPKVQIVADYVDKFAVGVRFAVTDDLKLGVATRDGDMMFSASYKFGFK